MNDTAPPHPIVTRVCSLCGKPLADDARFCPECGAGAVGPSTFATVDSYIDAKLGHEISKRLSDQNSLARELADKAEDVLWKRFRLLLMLIVVTLGAAALLGYKNINDVTQSIVGATSGKVDAVKGRLDQLAQDVGNQTRRVSEKGGEISERLSQLDGTANDAQAKINEYLKRAEDLSQQMAIRLAQLDVKVGQVSTQVDNLSVKQVYPSLGKAKFVTFNNMAWNKEDKKPGEKWISIYIEPQALGDFSAEEIEAFMRSLRVASYTPWLGQFALSGPFGVGFGSLGGYEVKSSLYYFSKESEKMTADVRENALKHLSITSLNVIYVNLSTIDANDARRFVIENSGLDLQLVLQPGSKK